MSALLPSVRELFSEHPKYFHYEPWEPRTVRALLGYVEHLADEAEIAAAVEVARGDYPQWRPAA